MQSDKKSWSAEILRLYLRNRYTPETEEKIQQWLAEKPETEDTEEVAKEYWDSVEPVRGKDTGKALRRVNAKIGIRSQAKRIGWHSAFSKVAAVFILLISIGGLWYYLRQQSHPAMVRLTASYGETKQVVLPDKSVVWLNAGSTLEYPSEFSQQTRHVSLTGEAFFSVTKNKAKPFVVTTANLSVRVLGTKFNLKAYPDDNRTVATLQEGRIAVRTKDKQQRKLLPNQQLTYNNRTSLVQIVKIAPGDIPDWKNGNLTFTDATLGEVLQTLRRRFNISIETDKSIDLSTEHYTIKFERGENPEQILRVLEDVAGDFTYTKENKRIVLHKK